MFFSEYIAIKTIGLNVVKTKMVFHEHFGDEFNFEAASKQRVEYIIQYIEENGIPIKPGLYQLLEFLKLNNICAAVAPSTERKTAEYYI